MIQQFKNDKIIITPLNQTRHTMLKTLLMIATLMLSGCASFNDAMTPGLTIKQDRFNGYTVINQPLVGAASSFSDDFNRLGFTWYEDAPTAVYLTVGVDGIQNIMDVTFNVDGLVIKGNKNSSFTDYGNISTRRFYVSMRDFILLSKGMDVLMKVSSIDYYTVSTFGSLNSIAVINRKFKPFIEQVIKHKALNNNIAYNQ